MKTVTFTLFRTLIILGAGFLIALAITEGWPPFPLAIAIFVLLWAYETVISSGGLND